MPETLSAPAQVDLDRMTVDWLDKIHDNQATRWNGQPTLHNLSVDLGDILTYCWEYSDNNDESPSGHTQVRFQVFLEVDPEKLLEQLKYMRNDKTSVRTWAGGAIKARAYPYQTRADKNGRS